MVKNKNLSIPNSQRSLRLPAPAKLNLFLNILNRRSDGFHNLQTIFHLLDTGDFITLHFREDKKVMLNFKNNEIKPSDNLVVRAAKMLQTIAGVSSGCEISLQKNIPIGAGLGGGSSNAATTLIGLNLLWNCKLDTNQLAKVGKTLGADVPVFVRGYSASAEGIGDMLNPISLPDIWYLIIVPSLHISTRRIFSHPELTRNSPPIKMSALNISQVTAGVLCKNDCQGVVETLHTEVKEVMEWLKTFGTPRLTGTGSGVFCSFQLRVSAERVQQKVPSEWRSFVAKGVNRSILYEQLENMI
ncbi:MAG: 4-(cytidine 5'-diphospho)-2-C-methyl-D-erythritol kinase [Cellvibrionales bacterium TMED49]|nr:4-(cytidine 5'-diphospho)-2-C-methyl-D-erythritol kinase [Porticoccaceae bacterium]OUU39347.1 MAG: 4-(cytidine 5'-diphospho)-2-C-methyl-D-erythritol kinase [Cellvibrionales bacterium TMED49]